MPGGDVQHLPLRARRRTHQFGDHVGRHSHHGRHGVREVHPDGMVGVHGAVGAHDFAALAHDRGHVLEAVGQHGRGEELLDRPEIRVGFPVQEQGAAGRQPVVRALLGQEAHNHQEVAQDAHAALGGFTPRGDRFGGEGALADYGEYIQLDSAFQRCTALVGIQGVEDKLGARLGLGDAAHAVKYTPLRASLGGTGRPAQCGDARQKAACLSQKRRQPALRFAGGPVTRLRVSGPVSAKILRPQARSARSMSMRSA